MLRAEDEGRTERIGRSTRELSSSVEGARACHGIACERAKLTPKKNVFDSHGANGSVDTGKEEEMNRRESTDARLPRATTAVHFSRTRSIRKWYVVVRHISWTATKGGAVVHIQMADPRP